MISGTIGAAADLQRDRLGHRRHASPPSDPFVWTVTRRQTAPAAPTGVVAAPANGAVTLSWTANGEADIAGYRVYRATSTPVPTTGNGLSASLITAPSYVDTTRRQRHRLPLRRRRRRHRRARLAGLGDRLGDAVGELRERAAAQRLEQYVTLRRRSEPRRDELHDRDLVPAHRRRRRRHDRHRRHHERDPAGHEGPRRGRGLGNVNMNYFLGIDAAHRPSRGRLRGGHRAAAGNHPITGATVVTQQRLASRRRDVRRHRHLAALPRRRPRRHASLVGAAAARRQHPARRARHRRSTSAGASRGLLRRARSTRCGSGTSPAAPRRSAETRFDEVTQRTGLIARYGLNEGTGTAVGNSAPARQRHHRRRPDLGRRLPARRPAAGSARGPERRPRPNARRPRLVGQRRGRPRRLPRLPRHHDARRHHRQRHRRRGLLTAPTYTDTTAVNGTTTATSSSRSTPPATPRQRRATVVATPAAAAGAARAVRRHERATSPSARRPRLGASTFTLETWFRRTGAGVGHDHRHRRHHQRHPARHQGPRRGGGLERRHELLPRHRRRPPAGSSPTSRTPAAGGNHPVSGTTVVTSNVWHHAAATYDGTTWRLYLDGVLDADARRRRTSRRAPTASSTPRSARP